MAKITFRREAIDDLSAIWLYTAQEWSENQADDYYQSIRQACLQLNAHSNSGKNYPRISKYILGFKSGKHIIFYQPVSEDEIDVIRILHERMDLENHFE